MKKTSRIIIALLLLFSIFGCNKGDSNANLNVNKISYRSILVSDFSGTVSIKDQINSEPFEAYVGMSLKNGDIVIVEEDSYLTLDVDSDKHIYVEPNTTFHLVAEGNEESNRTKIILETGSVLCQIQEKLKEDETFEIETVSSTMSVRGTVFRVSLIESTDTNNYELVEVYDGKVLSNIDKSENEVEFEAGQCGLIKEDSNGDNASFVTDDQIDTRFWNSSDTNMRVTKEEGTGSPVLPIAYNKLSTTVIDNLVTISESGQELAVSVDELNDLKEKPKDTQTYENKEVPKGVLNENEFRAGALNDDICAEYGHTIITVNGVRQCSVCGRRFSDEYEETEKDKQSTESAKESGMPMDVTLPDPINFEMEFSYPADGSSDDLEGKTTQK